jgi:hypothetical protein
MRRLNKRPHGAKAVAFWCIVFFALTQVALNVYVDGWQPEFYDPEFGVRKNILQARIAESPDRPLLLMIGSSRAEMCFLPEQLLPLYTETGAQALPFNFCHLGAGPTMNLLEVRRLLRAGIHPRWLLVEIMPPQLADQKQHIMQDSAALGDMPTVLRYKNPFLSAALFTRARLTP